MHTSTSPSSLTTKIVMSLFMGVSLSSCTTSANAKNLATPLKPVKDVHGATVYPTETDIEEAEEEEIEEEDLESDVDVNDPLEPLNRAIYFVNQGIDGLIFKPLAIAYRLLLPEPVRDSIENVLTNIGSPVSFVNHLLQGEPDRAGNSLIRFGINSTLGILGLFDAAETFGFKSFETGFAETLGRWGVNTGPYLILPALGPSSFRSVVGLGGDYFMQPYNYYFMQDAHNDEIWPWVVSGTRVVHERNLVLEKVDEVVDGSIDPYVTFRSIYFQSQAHRLKKLKEQ